MLENNAEEHKSLHSYLLENTQLSLEYQHSKEVSFRKRLHGLLLENFELKEGVGRLQGEVRSSEEQRKELKEHLKIALEELSANDKIIQSFKHTERQLRLTNKQLSDELATCQTEVQNCKQIIAGLIQHNQNLQTENHLITEIKQKYLHDLNKLKIEQDTLNTTNERLAKDNQLLSLQADRLLSEISGLQGELQTRRNDIEEYQKFVLEKLANAKNSEEFHELCREQVRTLHSKYAKYKQKACAYRQERDLLVLHLQQVSKAMDSSTLRKYYQEQDRQQGTVWKGGSGVQVPFPSPPPLWE